jgi:hypothetical protein
MIRRPCFVILFLTLSSCAHAPATGDVEKVRGTWILVWAKTDGAVVSEKTLAAGAFVFEDETLTLSEGEKKLPAT